MAETVIGRQHAKKQLKEAIDSTRSELIAVYGRRRIGKTYLIKNVYNKNICFEISGLHNVSMSDQLENFSIQLNRAWKKNHPSHITSWLQAFELLSDFIKQKRGKKKKVLFLDEFPWMATRRSRFLAAFENFWNTFASLRKDLVVVICGSAASWMIQRVVRSKGGLHNRLTGIIHLQPFSLSEAAQFLKHKSIQYTYYDILQIYMVLGGVPYYLEQIQKGESTVQCIDRLCFSSYGLLKTEFEHLFDSLFENAQNHIEVLKALSLKRKGMTRNEIISKISYQSGGGLTQILVELIESGFITQYYPFQKSKKTSLYRITDEYASFYLKFIKNANRVESGGWIKQYNTASVRAWFGFTFESICLKHIQQIKNALGIGAIYSTASSWVGTSGTDKTQIDLLIDRDDGIINICEMKHYNALFSISKKYAHELKQKIFIFKEETKTKKNVMLTMVSTYGCIKNKYYLELIQNDLQLEDLFKSS